MDYEYDIFLSYKRHHESRTWITEHFQPLLEFYVGEELGRPPVVFRDDHDIDAGTSWPPALGRALGNSRVLVALWSKLYFHSDWCSRELSTMLAREQDEQRRTAHRPDGLIVPVILHDCEALPTELQGIQSVAVTECFNVRMRSDSPLCELLAQYVAKLIAPCVAMAVTRAPLWQASWPLTTARAFLDAVKRPEPPRQTAVPRLP